MIKILILSFLTTFSNAHAAENKWYLYKYGDWSPDREIVSSIKDNLKTFVESGAKSQMQPIRGWGKYLLQYFGAIKDGERVVEIHAFCSLEDPSKLTHELIIILDGGSCYFQLLYHPASKQFSGLQINGEA